MKLLLDIETGPASPDSEFEWPHFATVIDDTIHVNIPDIFFSHKCLSERNKYRLSKLRSGDISQYRALLTCSHAFIAIHQLLELEVFFKRGSPPVGSEPPSYPHLDP